MGRGEGGFEGGGLREGMEGGGTCEGVKQEGATARGGGWGTGGSKGRNGVMREEVDVEEDGGGGEERWRWRRRRKTPTMTTTKGGMEKEMIKEE